MSHLQLSALLVAEGLITREELETVRGELSEGESLEDAILARGLVKPETLDRLLSLAQTPPPEEGTVTAGNPVDHTATAWEYEAPAIEGLDGDPEGEISMDAVTGRFDGLKPVGKTTRWDKEIDADPVKLTARTTRWEIPVPLPEENPTGEWISAPSEPALPPAQSLDDELRQRSDLLDSTSIEETGFETQIEEPPA